MDLAVDDRHFLELSLSSLPARRPFRHEGRHALMKIGAGVTCLEQIPIILHTPREAPELFLCGPQSDRGIGRDLPAQRGDRFVELLSFDNFRKKAGRLASSASISSAR
jgi:hypothetical protein